eukprot:CAMPEP_0119005202 /NCGR_PEP_ID=MMETSP1176-20130426/1581_1 /TAXON_ID=265551 /ORGANISM="Synedropsis recta cf, Strain CCMP1620" /LENGTH=287 /DNA_ID=CAMNT_0006956979 /DNA_START=16 /DNA_END=879 /DNA_ORIENTATION=+
MKQFPTLFLVAWSAGVAVDGLQVVPQRSILPQGVAKHAAAFCLAGACLLATPTTPPALAASDIVFGPLETAIIAASDATYPVLKSLTTETVSPLGTKIANLVNNKIAAAKLTAALDSGANALLSIPDEKLAKFATTVKESYQGVSSDFCTAIPLPVDAINSLTPTAASSLDATKLEQVTKKLAATAEAIPFTSTGICLPSSKEGLEQLWIGQTELVIGIPKAAKQDLVAKAGAAVKSVPNADLLRILPDAKKILKGVDPKTAKKFESTGQTLDKVLKADVRFKSLSL